ncbi:hypothetical protein GCM10011506_30140 [Marivirga lumbricoides]|uniref:Transglutaminase-like domain-containing protein n=1 Tax=Marivirga lumbricoides TaxID=1046115 RepID=A0ABQ1ML29_9BACT|nr:hypothetical protein GCM10011506_30140 [Marivirga lumbricoides]
METLKKRYIKPGHEFNRLMPRSINLDSVVRPAGKAQLHHTINLIREIVPETKEDTRLLAQRLKGQTVRETCRNIWQFVYNHIQYARDKAGIEQVRRPSRTWADRRKGVDCDCYSVFISSILTNLNIPHQLRITKYGGKPNFQHIYPIVTLNNGSHITLDCVTDHFDFEVPYSDVMDFDMSTTPKVDEINGYNGICGVDSLDLLLNGPDRPGEFALRKIVRAKQSESSPTRKLILKPVLSKQSTGMKESELPKASLSTVEIKPAAPSLNTKNLPSSGKQAGKLCKIVFSVAIGMGAFKIIQLLT